MKSSIGAFGMGALIILGSPFSKYLDAPIRKVSDSSKPLARGALACARKSKQDSSS